MILQAREIILRGVVNVIDLEGYTHFYLRLCSSEALNRVYLVAFANLTALKRFISEHSSFITAYARSCDFIYFNLKMGCRFQCSMFNFCDTDKTKTVLRNSTLFGDSLIDFRVKVLPYFKVANILQKPITEFYVPDCEDLCEVSYTPVAMGSFSEDITPIPVYDILAYSCVRYVTFSFRDSTGAVYNLCDNRYLKSKLQVSPSQSTCLAFSLDTANTENYGPQYSLFFTYHKFLNGDSFMFTGGDYEFGESELRKAMQNTLIQPKKCLFQYNGDYLNHISYVGTLADFIKFYPMLDFMPATEIIRKKYYEFLKLIKKIPRGLDFQPLTVPDNFILSRM